MVNNHDSDTEKGIETNNPNSYISGRWLWAIGALAFVGMGLVAWLGFWLFDKGKDRAIFISGASINVLILAAVLLQAFIYRRQWDSMQDALRIERAKIAPRVRVAEVRVENFQEGKQPAFIVILVNDGATDARDVSIHMRVRLREGDKLALKWKTPTVETIAANQHKVYFLPWKTPLTQDYINEVEARKVPMEVEVTFQVDKSPRQKLCYRYYPWNDGERPEGIPQFLSCDFDTRLVTVVKSPRPPIGDPTIELRMDDAPAEAKSDAERGYAIEVPGPGARKRSAAHTWGLGSFLVAA